MKELLTDDICLSTLLLLPQVADDGEQLTV